MKCKNCTGKDKMAQIQSEQIQILNRNVLELQKKITQMDIQSNNLLFQNKMLLKQKQVFHQYENDMAMKAKLGSPHTELLVLHLERLYRKLCQVTDFDMNIITTDVKKNVVLSEDSINAIFTKLDLLKYQAQINNRKPIIASDAKVSVARRPQNTINNSAIQTQTPEFTDAAVEAVVKQETKEIGTRVDSKEQEIQTELSSKQSKEVKSQALNVKINNSAIQTQTPEFTDAAVEAKAVIQNGATQKASHNKSSHLKDVVDKNITAIKNNEILSDSLKGRKDFYDQSNRPTPDFKQMTDSIQSRLKSHNKPQNEFMGSKINQIFNTKRHDGSVYSRKSGFEDLVRTANITSTVTKKLGLQLDESDSKSLAKYQAVRQFVESRGIINKYR